MCAYGEPKCADHPVRWGFTKQVKSLDSRENHVIA